MKKLISKKVLRFLENLTVSNSPLPYLKLKYDGSGKVVNSYPGVNSYKFNNLDELDKLIDEISWVMIHNGFEKSELGYHISEENRIDLDKLISNTIYHYEQNVNLGMG